jgi:hypothetical protein
MPLKPNKKAIPTRVPIIVSIVGSLNQLGDLFNFRVEQIDFGFVSGDRLLKNYLGNLTFKAIAAKHYYLRKINY